MHNWKWVNFRKMAGFNIISLSLNERQSNSDKKHNKSLRLVLFFPFRCCFAGCLPFSLSTVKRTKLFSSISDFRFPPFSADQSLICNPRSIRDRSPPSHLVFSGTRSILHHHCACHNMHWMILFRLDSQSTLHSEYGLIWADINSLDLNKIKNDSGTPLYGHPLNTNTRGYITDSFVCPDKKLINFP